MSLTPQQAVRDSTSSLGDVFENIIGEVTEDIETVETKDIQIEDTSTPAVDLPPDNSPTPWWIMSLPGKTSMGRRLSL